MITSHHGLDRFLRMLSSLRNAHNPVPTYDGHYNVHCQVAVCVQIYLDDAIISLWFVEEHMDHV